MTAPTTFGQWLKQRRKSMDLTREELAGRIGCAPNTLYKIEADERRPSKQIAELLAQHLNIPADDRAAFVRFARVEAVEDAAPWGTAFHPPTNLPTQPTLLIGRDAEAAAVCKQLLHPQVHLLTLTGPPGIGKTRLALQVAVQMLDDFADGVFLVALAPISDASLVFTTIASILGVLDMGLQPPLDRLKGFLHDKQMLLLLDNFEQILAAAPSIAELLNVCPDLKLLVTSRSPLRIRHERQIPVSPLAVPDLVRQPDVERMTDYTAVTLFLERAQAVQPDFVLTPENAPTIAALCARLDGLPLAIELISARIKLLPPAALLERLRGRLLLQSDGLRDLEPRHRTLNAAIGWSYQLLKTDEQTLFRRLGVFVGGWTLAAAGAICMENLNFNLLDGLTSLLNNNLVKSDARSEGEPRFMMLETIHEYGLEQLADSEELADLRKRHTEYFLQLAEGAEAHAYGREQLAWFDRLEAELDNLRAVLGWSLASETGLRLAGVLGWFFRQRSHWIEGLHWLERTLAANPSASDSLRAKAFHRAGMLASLLGNERRACALSEQGLALARALNHRWNIAWSLNCLGYYNEGDLDQSVALLEESLALFREIEDPMGLSYTLYRLAYRVLDQKDYSYVCTLLEELAIYAHEADDKFILAWMFHLMGRVAWSQDHDLRQVKAHYESSLSLFREARFQDGINMALGNLAALERAAGNFERSQMLYEEALILHRENLFDHPRVPFIVAGLASVARARGQFERAARLLGAANNSWLVNFANLHPELVPFESDIAEVRSQLGENAFGAAWAEGRALTLNQVVAYALNQTE